MSQYEPSEEERAAIREQRREKPQTALALPCSNDVEKGLMCSFLLAPNEVGNLCQDEGFDVQWMHVPGHQVLSAAMLAVWGSNKPLDSISLTQYLHDHKQLEAAGGAAYVMEIFMLLPTAANARHYLGILKEKFTLRKVIEVGTRFTTRGYEDQEDVPGVLDAFEREVLAIRADKDKRQIVSARQGIVEALNSIHAAFDRRGVPQGMQSGFADLDEMLNGIQKKELTIIAGRPSEGKTALAMNIAEYMGCDTKKPGLVFTIEMSTQQLLQRLVLGRARVNLVKVRQGHVTARDANDINDAAEEIGHAPIYFDDSNPLTIQELQAKARRMKQLHGIEWVVVDYLQLLRSNSKRAQHNREQEVAECSAGLKATAKELDIAMVALCQVNRGVEQRADPRPKLSDLRESGSLEQDADTVAFVYRPERYAQNDKDKEALEGQAELIIAKQRNGPLGTVPLTFFREYTRFEGREVSQEERQGEMQL